MLRLLVLLLVLVNAAYFAWSHEMLRVYGFGPSRQAEPERLGQQIRPELLVILSAEEAREMDAQALPPPANTAVSCLQAGLFDVAQVQALRQVAQIALPSGAWTLSEVAVPPRWFVYMGKYPDTQALTKKRAELATLGVRADALASGALALGLSLGAFESEERANAELTALVKRGVRTALVVQDPVQARFSLLRITPVDDAVRARLDELKPVLAGKALRSCS